jgi:hypothetical protein
MSKILEDIAEICREQRFRFLCRTVYQTGLESKSSDLFRSYVDSFYTSVACCESVIKFLKRGDDRKWCDKKLKQGGGLSYRVHGE